MTAVLIHASGIGNREGARNWQNTIETPVDFRGVGLAEALSASEREILDQLHPQGHAQFWGTHRYYSMQMARLATGDVVIFTGLGRVLGMGRIGLLTDNPALGDRLWPRHQKHASYRHVYSLAPLTMLEMSQVDFRRRGGFSANDDFRGLRVLDSSRADALVAEFAEEIPLATGSSSSPVERAMADIRGYEDADERLAADLGSVRELDIEVRSTGDTRVRSRAASSMHRGESLLVHAYAASLDRGARWCRYTTPAGVTDLDVFNGRGHELIEAKSSSRRSHVRQALAQLLDYAPALGDQRPDQLTALFPSEPDESAVGLLHRYGVDCVYRTPGGVFVRREAPTSVREAITRLW